MNADLKIDKIKMWFRIRQKMYNENNGSDGFNQNCKALETKTSSYLNAYHSSILAFIHIQY
jgi:hypothetical protein